MCTIRSAFLPDPKSVFSLSRTPPVGSREALRVDDDPERNLLIPDLGVLASKGVAGDSADAAGESCPPPPGLPGDCEKYPGPAAVANPEGGVMYTMRYSGVPSESSEEEPSVFVDAVAAESSAVVACNVGVSLSVLSQARISLRICVRYRSLSVVATRNTCAKGRSSRLACTRCRVSGLCFALSNSSARGIKRVGSD